MALTEKQIKLLESSRPDLDIAEVIFPSILSPNDWRLAVQERKIAFDKRTTRGGLIEVGIAWAANDTLQTARKRRIPPAQTNSLIPIVMLYEGSHWTPDHLLRHLAHRQLGLPFPGFPMVGSISSDQLIKEFKEKLEHSLQFAWCYLEHRHLPEKIDGKKMEAISTIEEYNKWKEALLKTPPPRYPQRHAFAESLAEACKNILEQVEHLESAGDCNHLGHLCMLMGWVFEAGKFHAYLEREKDPGAIAENLEGARRTRNKSSPTRQILEHTFYEFWQRHGRNPTISEFRTELDVTRVTSKSPGMPDELTFQGLALDQKEFKNFFDQIKKSFKKQSS